MLLRKTVVFRRFHKVLHTGGRSLSGGRHGSLSADFSQIKEIYKDVPMMRNVLFLYEFCNF